MKAAVIATLILLLPATLLARPTMGIYFTYVPGTMYYDPAPFEEFNGYVFGHNIQCYLDAAEFQVACPPRILMIDFTWPEGALVLGQPSDGISLAYWPPMDGWNPGYNLLCTLHLLTIQGCDGVVNAYIQIVPHHVTGLDQGSCWPDNNLFEFTGLTSVLCPSEFAVQAKTWGSIKSMF